ncbi:MAG: hypothetical protein KC516_04600 [Nanoarchaeota archaeon]|nr:hypothetical protein [Nanoarchaeota archaeon]
MVNLDWCYKQSKGIKFIEPNENLSNQYLKNAEETLLDLKDNKESNLWKATKKYYFEYFLIYSLLMKLGIKCEIHDCTIVLIKKFEEMDLLTKDTHKILKKDKEIRIDNQYYLKDKEVKINYAKLFEFFLEMKSIIRSLNVNKIKEIRRQLKK